MNSPDTYIIFELAGSVYALQSRHVQHIEMLDQITPVPNAAPALDGVVFSRGQVVPAINLRARFGLPRQEATLQTRVLFVHVADRVVALVVDSAREFQRIPPETIRPIQETLVGIEGNYVEGVATVRGRNVLLVDVARVLSLDEIMPPANAPLPR